MNFMTISREAIEAIKSDPEFAQFVGKDATAADVHVSSTGGGKPPPKRAPGTKPPKVMTFDDLMAEAGAPATDRDKSDVDPIAQALEKMEAAHKAERDALVKMLEMSKLAGPRTLRPHESGSAHSPFPFDPQAMSSLHEDQIRRFLAALTNQDDQEDRRVGVNSLVALQPRIDPDKVNAFRQAYEAGKVHKVDVKPPLVVRFGGRNYLADGHHRAAAQWLDGAQTIDCKYCNIDGADEELNKAGEWVKWDMPIEFAKASGDRQMIFGVASTVEEGGRLIIDKQDDGIPVQELENAVYEYVLDARAHGDMHTVDDKGSTGRLLESFMITDEKRAAYAAAGYTLSFKNENGEEVSGWLVGYKVDDPTTWARCKSGELPEFSIGGRSLRTPVTEAEMIAADRAARKYLIGPNKSDTRQ